MFVAAITNQSHCACILSCFTNKHIIESRISGIWFTTVGRVLLVSEEEMALQVWSITDWNMFDEGNLQSTVGVIMYYTTDLNSLSTRFPGQLHLISMCCDFNCFKSERYVLMSVCYSQSSISSAITWIWRKWLWVKTHTVTAGSSRPISQSNNTNATVFAENESEHNTSIQNFFKTSYFWNFIFRQQVFWCSGCTYVRIDGIFSIMWQIFRTALGLPY